MYGDDGGSGAAPVVWWGVVMLVLVMVVVMLWSWCGREKPDRVWLPQCVVVEQCSVHIGKWAGAGLVLMEMSGRTKRLTIWFSYGGAALCVRACLHT